jgi:DNA-binding SARP family transcriptional activator/predicted ATPase
MLRVLVLGPTELAVAGDRRSLGGPIPRALLVLLAQQEGRPVPDDILLETAWSGNPPASGRHALDVYISTLRKTVAPAATIARSGQGFTLSTVEGAELAVDADEFTRLGDAARSAVARGDLDSARETIDHALSLWRSRPFADLPESDEWTVESARLEALRAELLQLRAECRVAAGDLSAVAELRAFADQDPYDETTQMRLMRALYLGGRQQDALDVFAGFARRIRSELGLEPSAAMVALERAVLNHRLGAGGQDRPRRSQPVFGRQQLVDDVTELLTERTKVVTLVGMGGIGKTTIGIAVADRFAEDEHLVTWIAAEELSGGDVPARVAQEITGRRNVDPFDVRLERDLPRLLVIDAFEGHEDEAEYLDFLVGALPSLRILLSSRRPSRVAAEWIVQIPPLESPSDALTIAELRATPAGALFTDLIERRARGALDEPGAVATAAAICRRLAGIPLALELAAARVGVLSVEDLAETLDIASLAGGTTSAPAHRSMSRVLDSTVGLLSANARRALEAAAVFRSPFTPTDIATVSDLPESRIEPILRELYDAGLIASSRQLGGRRHFTLLEPIREYAAEALRVDGLEEDARTRYLDRIVQRTTELAEAFTVPATQVQAVAQFDGMRPDFAAAVEFAIAENRTHEAIDLVVGATVFWRRLSAREGIAWLTRVRDLDVDEPDRIRVLREVFAMLHISGRVEEAFEASDQLMASGAATLKDRQNYAAVRADSGDAQAAIELFKSIAVEARAERNGPILLQSLSYLCQTNVSEGAYDEALFYAGEAEAALAEFDAPPVHRAYVRAFQSKSYLITGDERTAAALVRESLTLGVGVQDAHITSAALLIVGDLALSRGDDTRGRAIAATAVAALERTGFVLPKVHVATLPGDRLATMVAGTADLPFSEAVEQAHAVLDEILAD